MELLVTVITWVYAIAMIAARWVFYNKIGTSGPLSIVPVLTDCVMCQTIWTGGAYLGVVANFLLFMTNTPFDLNGFYLLIFLIIHCITYYRLGEMFDAPFIVRVGLVILAPIALFCIVFHLFGMDYEFDPTKRIRFGTYVWSNIPEKIKKITGKGNS